MLKKSIFLFFFCFSLLPLQAENTLSYDLAYLKDMSGSLSIADVQKKAFIPQHKGVQNFGITNVPFWFKLRIHPKQQNLTNNWWVKIDYPPLDYIDYYLFDADQTLIKTIHSGELRPFKERELSDPGFIHQLPLTQAKEYTLYIRVLTEGALQVPLSLICSRSMIESQYIPLLTAGLYYGLVLIIALYSSVIFLYTRDRNYLYYFIFVNSFVFWQLSLDGIGTAYLWGDFPWLVEHASVLSTSLLTFSAVLFARSFLQTSIFTPKMDIYLKYLMYFALVLTFSATFVPYHDIIKIDGILSIFVPILLFATGIIVLKRGYKPARFYIIAWFAFLVGCILFSLNKFNIIGGFYLMNHAQQIGSAIEMIMLSWALGDRVKSIQERYLNKAKNLNATLQKRIKNGLEKERQKDKIMIQQSRFAALGTMIEQIAHQWRQPLNTLALINQNLYFKFKLHKFDPQAFDDAHEKIDENLQYMSQTIDDFRNFYKNNAEAETYEVIDVLNSATSLSEAMIKYAKISIHVENSANCYVHNVRNELLQVCMNILKNAHDALLEKRPKERRIHIKIYPHENDLCIQIEDNAGGIDNEIIDKIFNPYFTTKEATNGTGIGLYMSKFIIEEHLNGEIKVENTEDGARFTIALPNANKLVIEGAAKVEAC